MNHSEVFLWCFAGACLVLAGVLVALGVIED